MSKKKNRYNRECMFCSRKAIWAMQTLFTNQGKRVTPKTFQLRTKPHLCAECVYPIRDLFLIYDRRFAWDVVEDAFKRCECPAIFYLSIGEKE